MRVTAIVPALDEEAVIGNVVRDVPRDHVHEIIVVDNGSGDRTAAAAAASGARVVQESTRGYGAACQAGVNAAANADILVFLDGDGSDDPTEIPSVLQPLLSGRADLVLGSRTRGISEEGALTVQQRVGNRIVLLFVRLLYGIALTDLGPFRAVRADLLRTLQMEHRTFGWPVEMIVKAARQGLRIAEVPTRCRRRVGRSKVAGTIRGSLLAGYHLIATTLRYAWKR